MPYIAEKKQIRTKVLGVTIDNRQEILEMMKKDSASVHSVYMIDNSETYAKIGKNTYSLGKIKKNEYDEVLSKNKGTIIAWYVTGGSTVDNGLTIDKLNYGLNIVIHLTPIELIKKY